jgi:uncharacterized membrane protein
MGDRAVRRGQEREILEIGGTTISMELIRGPHRQMTVFPRHWTKVKLRAPLHGLHPSRLSLESQERTCGVGIFLTEDERCSLATRLKQLIGNV